MLFRSGRRLFEVGGRLAFAVASDRRRNALANLARILGRDPGDAVVRATAIEAFELYARYWFDSFRLPAVPITSIDARIEAIGFDNLDRALAAGRGCVGAIGHLGNPDVVAAWAAWKGYPIASVAERLRPERLFQLFRRQREGYGVRRPHSPVEEGHVSEEISPAERGQMALFAPLERHLDSYRAFPDEIDFVSGVLPREYLLAGRSRPLFDIGLERG